MQLTTFTIMICLTTICYQTTPVLSFLHSYLMQSWLSAQHLDARKTP